MSVQDRQELAAWETQRLTNQQAHREVYPEASYGDWADVSIGS